MTQAQYLHCEQDPRVRRSFAWALLVSALVILGALVVVGLRVQQVHLAYRLDAVHVERGRLETALRQLEVEVATLRAPGRLETQARQLGMTAPARDQVRLAREFVAVSTGLAALERNRVAVVDGALATP